MQIWSTLFHRLFVGIDKMNGFVICSRPKFPTKKLQKNCWQKADHHKTPTNIQSGEKKIHDLVKRSKQIHLVLKQPQTHQRNKIQWATFNHAGEVVTKRFRTKIAKEVGETCEVGTFFPVTYNPRGQHNQQRNQNKTCYEYGRHFGLNLI